MLSTFDRPEAHGLGLLGAMGYTPGAVGMLSIGQVLEVVLDVLARGMVFRSHSDQIQKVGFGWERSTPPFKTNLGKPVGWTD